MRRIGAQGKDTGTALAAEGRAGQPSPVQSARDEVGRRIKELEAARRREEQVRAHA